MQVGVQCWKICYTGWLYMTDAWHVPCFSSYPIPKEQNEGDFCKKKKTWFPFKLLTPLLPIENPTQQNFQLISHIATSNVFQFIYLLAAAISCPA